MVSSKRKKQAPKIQNVVQRKTKRATVPALEKILYKPIKLLDHGFIRVIDYMGDDRQSFKPQGFLTAPERKK